MGTLIIRKVDDVVIERLNQLSKERNYSSREAYLREYINNLVVLSEFKMLDNKYNALVQNVVEAIKTNNETLDEILNLLKSK